MDHKMHNARITGRVSYDSGDGVMADVPLGPCLVEQLDAHLFDIIWGAAGQLSAEMPGVMVREAAERGDLVLLD